MNTAKALSLQGFFVSVSTRAIRGAWENCMNKQQLAAKIWESANQMRSKIEANEYKDYILGFIFYKYLSDKLEQFAKAQDFTDEDIQALAEDEPEIVRHMQLGFTSWRGIAVAICCC